MSTDTSTDLQKRIEELKPWRYDHSHNGVQIKSDNAHAARIHETYGKGVLTHILNALLSTISPTSMRALDLGCLEGHYSDILCAANFGEVVSIDLSEDHVKRAEFLLKELKGYDNSTVLQGNASDEQIISSLGKFNIVLFHGLLYHLKDPLKIFDVIERVIPDGENFHLLLSTQYHGRFSSLVSPYPMAELQIKALPQTNEGLRPSGSDGSVFERCSFRLNPAAVYQVLKLYDYQGIIAYDTPGGHSYSFHSNLIVSKNRSPELVETLNKNVTIPGLRFYEWDGRSVDSYAFSGRLEARAVRSLARPASRLIELVRRARVRR